MAEPEAWSWRKWFGGFIEGRRYGKDMAILLRLAVLLVVGYFIVMGVMWTKDKFFGEKVKTQPVVINSGGAPVDNSTKKNWFSLLDINFGGQDK